ncbi:hypothetical protein [Desulfogranum marinum]|jgi:hypothetical protein|uniref:hypothetical protein n=1 Tax=Desulfogranum marinum TaxID=453220 RepID=UPI00196575A6|nr:hypothetical protein [Desulfogranum marinum]MBM9515052.1 hypothetical protein [Desulfogranum marinum]
MNAEQQQYKISHLFLVEAESAQEGAERVAHYLTGNQLITYSDLVIRPDEIIGSKEGRFWPMLEKGIAKNMDFALSLVESLKDEGIETIEDLVHMEEGYLTKLLHTLTHLLDGFIGVDSVFYNLVEDSHRISRTLKKSVDAQHEKYWLIPVRTGMLEASVLHL